MASIQDSYVENTFDEVILASLQQYRPITSEKNVWAFWDAGFTNAKPWVQRNVINWVRRLGPLGWTIHVLDRVPGSPVNVARYVEDACFFPAAFNDESMTGRHTGPHSADIVRLPLLYLYGGVWMDVGSLLFRDLDDICWDALCDPSTPYEMAGFTIKIRPKDYCIYNGFIAARRQNPFIKRWHDIYLELWKGATSSDEFWAHSLLEHLRPLMPTEDFPAKIEVFKDIQEELKNWVNYLAHMLCFERLSLLEDPSDHFSGPQYLTTRAMFFKAQKEVYFAQHLTQWDGSKQFKYLSTKCNGTPDSHDDIQVRAEAAVFVDLVLTGSSMMKLSHAMPNGNVYLANLWDDSKNANMDSIPGTFGALLRSASVELKTERALELHVLRPEFRRVEKVGVTEGVGRRAVQWRMLRMMGMVNMPLTIRNRLIVWFVKASHWLGF